MNVQVKIPDEILVSEESDISRQILEAVALEGYKSGQISAAQIKKILGFKSRFEVLDFLAKNEVAWVDYPVEDAERERILLRERLK